MLGIWSWLIKNEEWVFSGIGATVIGIFLPLILNKKRKRKNANLKLVSIDIIDDIQEIKRFYQKWPDEHQEYDINKCSSKSIIKIGDEPPIISYLDKYHKHVNCLPIIDVKLRNIGDEPAIISYVDFYIEVIKTELDRSAHEYLKISCEYSILIDPQKKNDFKTINTSQLVPPNNVDRFAIIIGSEKNAFDFIECNLDIRLKYNEKSELNLGKHRIKIIPPTWFKGNNIGIKHIPE